MTDSSPTTRPMRLLALALAAALLVGCTSADDTAADTPTDGVTADGPVGDCERTVAAPDIEYRSTSDLTDEERQVIELFRERSASVLVEQNPVSCRGLVEVAGPVTAEEFGAFEVKSFAHTDPAVRYDLFWFTERQAVDATIRDDIAERLSVAQEPDISLRVWAVANTLFLAATMPAGDDDAAAIADYYNQIIAGEE